MATSGQEDRSAWKETNNKTAKTCPGATKTWTNKDQAQYRTYQRDDNTHHYCMLDNPEQNNPQWPFQIWQQNTNKSLLSQLNLLDSLKQNKYDACLIQEPYIDSKGKTRANHNWAVIYPMTHDKYPDHTHSVILINTNIVDRSTLQIDLGTHPRRFALHIWVSHDSMNNFEHVRMNIERSTIYFERYRTVRSTSTLRSNIHKSPHVFYDLLRTLFDKYWTGFEQSINFEWLYREFDLFELVQSTSNLVRSTWTFFVIHPPSHQSLCERYTSSTNICERPNSFDLVR
jgi:hypothetical protein